MIVMRTPKGWTCPPVVDGQQVEGTFRAHQVPLPAARTDDEHRRVLEQWMRSYRPEELFDDDGRPVPELLAFPPTGDRRMSANPVANGGRLLHDLDLPDVARIRRLGRAAGRVVRTRRRGSSVPGCATSPGRTPIASCCSRPTSSPATGSRTSSRSPVGSGRPRSATYDEKLDPEGRVIEMLSEHVCQGLLEGYLLTGRHGAFTCYEAFIHIVDSMFNQHAKWLEASSHLTWRRPIASLNYLLSSHVWRQDHNGFTHQDPGFLDVVLNKKPEIVRVYLPPDANTLLSTFDHCLRSRHYVNVVVAGKQPNFDWLSVDEADAHCARGIGIWDWAGTEGDAGTPPDVVLACAGDVPTLETLAAASILRTELPDLRVRVVNVVDLMRLLPAEDHPHGLPDRDFDILFTEDRPIIFAFHGYPWLLHRLTYRRHNHDGLHVRGFEENGTTTTPFDMVMLNRLDRYHLVMDVIDRVAGLGTRAAALHQQMNDARIRAKAWTREHGEDIPEVVAWSWAG